MNVSVEQALSVLAEEWGQQLGYRLLCKCAGSGSMAESYLKTRLYDYFGRCGIPTMGGGTQRFPSLTGKGEDIERTWLPALTHEVRRVKVDYGRPGFFALPARISFRKEGNGAALDWEGVWEPGRFCYTTSLSLSPNREGFPGRYLGPALRQLVCDIAYTAIPQVEWSTTELFWSSIDYVGGGSRPPVGPRLGFLETDGTEPAGAHPGKEVV